MQQHFCDMYCKYCFIFVLEMVFFQHVALVVFCLCSNSCCVECSAGHNSNSRIVRTVIYVLIGNILLQEQKYSILSRRHAHTNADDIR